MRLDNELLSVAGKYHHYKANIEFEKKKMAKIKKHEIEKKTAKQKSERERIALQNNLRSFVANAGLSPKKETSGDITGYFSTSSHSLGINGNGTVSVYLSKYSDSKANISVKGNFSEGNLLNIGEIELEVEKCYWSGFLFCKAGGRETYKASTSNLSRVGSIVASELDKLKSTMDEKGRRKAAIARSESAESWRRASVQASSGSSSISSSNNKSNNSYQCSFKCYNFGGVTGLGKEGGSENEFKISASSNNEAKRLGLPHAKKVCKSAGYDEVLSQWGSGSISCR